jgi:hypothetical protein
MVESGRRDDAIEGYRNAISLSPSGPRSAHWKAKLKSLLLDKEREGKPGLEVCTACGCDAPPKARRCPNCGATLHLGFFEWLVKPENYRRMTKRLVGVMALSMVLSAAFSALPLLAKSCVAVSTLIVGTLYFLNALGG